MQTLTTHWLPN